MTNRWFSIPRPLFVYCPFAFVPSLTFVNPEGATRAILQTTDINQRHVYIIIIVLSHISSPEFANNVFLSWAYTTFNETTMFMNEVYVRWMRNRCVLVTTIRPLYTCLCVHARARVWGRRGGRGTRGGAWPFVLAGPAQQSVATFHCRSHSSRGQLQNEGAWC